MPDSTPANPPHLIPCVEICPGKTHQQNRLKKLKKFLNSQVHLL